MSQKVCGFNYDTNEFVIYGDRGEELFQTTEMSSTCAHALMKVIAELRSNSYHTGARFVTSAVTRLMENLP